MAKDAWNLRVEDLTGDEKIVASCPCGHAARLDVGVIITKRQGYEFVSNLGWHCRCARCGQRKDIKVVSGAQAVWFDG